MGLGNISYKLDNMVISKQHIKIKSKVYLLVIKTGFMRINVNTYIAVD